MQNSFQIDVITPVENINLGTFDEFHDKYIDKL